jgi:hypothetical protein
MVLLGFLLLLGPMDEEVVAIPVMQDIPSPEDLVPIKPLLLSRVLLLHNSPVTLYGLLSMELRMLLPSMLPPIVLMQVPLGKQGIPKTMLPRVKPLLRIKYKYEML